jgi:hypothetical protein
MIVVVGYNALIVGVHLKGIYSSGGAQVQLRKHAKKHRTTPHYPLDVSHYLP